MDYIIVFQKIKQSLLILFHLFLGMSFSKNKIKPTHAVSSYLDIQAGYTSGGRETDVSPLTPSFHHYDFLKNTFNFLVTSFHGKIVLYNYYGCISLPQAPISGQSLNFSV